MGGYPPRIDTGNKEHQAIRRHFKNMFMSLGYTMPCIFCRESYRDFYKELPIEAFLGGRIDLMRWLYKMRDKVNRKLIRQEKVCYDTEKKRLKRLFHNNQITNNDYYAAVSKAKNEILVTQSSPPFQQVLDKYESLRAVCSDRAKKCIQKE
jgi:hypothetical protein